MGIREKSVKIYDCYEKDWMGFKITKKNPYSFHHIVKSCDGGKTIINNFAILFFINGLLLFTICLIIPSPNIDANTMANNSIMATLVYFFLLNKKKEIIIHIIPKSPLKVIAIINLSRNLFLL